MAKAQTLNFPKGASYMIPFQFRSPGNDVGDWTGWRVYFIVKKQLSDPDTAALVNQTIIADPSTGYNELVLSGTETNAYPVGRYFYQATVVDGTGTVGKSEIGAFIVEETTLLSDAGDYEGPDAPVGPPGAGEFTYGAVRPIILDVNIVSTVGMSPGIYDPRHIQADVFDVDNHTDGIVNRVFTAVEQDKLGGIANGATANATDAYLLARANHTGTQAIATVAGLQSALDSKSDVTALNAHINDKNNPHETTKTQVGLPNVDNTADAVKNVLSATKLTNARQINGVSFDGTANITIADSTKEPILAPGTTGQYYRGDKTWQTLNRAAVGLPNVDNTADSAKPISTAVQTALNAKADTAALTAHTTNTSNPHNVTAAQVGLGNVDNTSDADKPISTATQEALDEKLSNESYATSGRFPVMNIKLDVTGDSAIQDPVTLDPKSKDVYVPGAYSITDTNQGILHSGGLRLRGRGNSTWGAVKKPWRINFDNKTAPLGMTANEKNWALLAMWYDKSRLGNLFAYELGARMSGLPWTPQIRMVELVLNNTYRGVYQLADLVRLEGARVQGETVSGSNVTGTWLMEIDNKEGPNGNGSELNGYFTPLWNQWIIYDDPEEPTTDQVDYIVDYMGQVERAIYADTVSGGVTFSDYIDPYAMADWWLINEIGYNVDSYFYSSCKIVKSQNGKLVMGPLWDHDSTFGMQWSTPHRDDIINGAMRTSWRTRNGKWLTELWKIPEWRAFAKARWLVLLEKVADMGGVDVWVDKTWKMLADPMLRDDATWPTSQENSTKIQSWSADYRKRWIHSSIDWLTLQFDGVTASTATIDTYMTGRASRLYPVDPYNNQY